MDAALQRRSVLASLLHGQSLIETSTNLETLEHRGVAADAPALPRFAAGDVINGRYDVLHILGEGGMGVVYAVRDRMFQLRPTALKTMRRLSDGEWLDLFRSEFIVLSELNHPNVAGVYDFGPLAGGAGHFFTMEFVQGTTLGRACEGASPSEIWRSICQMGEALAYLHSRDVLHLDVKPDNAVLMHDGTCKLLDFGLVGLAQKPGRVAGTLAYMDPELLQTGRPSVLSDLYCLGVSGLELLVGCRPFADISTAAAVTAAKYKGQFSFTTSQMEAVPAPMRDCLLKLCAKASQSHYASATDFLEAAAFVQGSARRRLTAVRSAFVGRVDERQRVQDFVHRRLAGADGPVLCTISAPSGMGKSRLVAAIRHELQANGHVFLQGDAYDQDIAEFTALTPVLLASAQLVISRGRRDVVDIFLPELVKMTPEFGHIYGATPSLPYSHGEAERERIARAARDYMLAVSRVTPVVMFLNDLQWASAGTINALKCIVEALASDPSARLAVLVSFRSDQIGGRPIEGCLTPFAAERTTDVVLAPLDVGQVRSMMRSMLGMAPSDAAVVRMHESSCGVPLYIDDTIRWLVKQDALQAVRGEIVAAANLQWRLEIDQRVVARASQLSAAGQRIMKLLAVSARPLALVHLRAAAQLPEHVLLEQLHHLEREHLVTPVASDSATYSLDHDRVREALFGSLTSSERVGLHQRLGAAFLEDFTTTRRDDVAVYSAFHLNQTALPESDADRLQRGDLNLDAARSARNAGDFPGALVFLQAAEAALAPDIWRQHARAMRLTEQRATTLKAMLQFQACIAECDVGIAHARDLIEEGRMCVPKMESLTQIRRHDEVLDTYVSFANRASHDFRVPRHPRQLSAMVAALKTRRLVRKHGVSHLMRPMEAGSHPLAAQTVRVTESAVNSAFVAAPHLFVFEGLTLARLACRHGTPTMSALTGPVTISTIVGILRDFDTVSELGRAVATLLDALPDEHRGRARFYWAAWPANLSVPLAQLVDPMAAAVLECSRARDWQEANAQWASLVIDFFVGAQPLSVTAERVRAVLDHWQAAERPDAAHFMELLQKTIAALHVRVSGEGTATLWSESLGVDVSWSTTTLAVARGFEMALAAWGGGGRPGGFGWRDVRLLSQGLPGTVPERLSLFFAAIANCTALRARLPLSRRFELKLVTRYLLRTLRRYAALNPTDFAHRVTFLEAELLRTKGKLAAAELRYRGAAAQITEAGFRGEHALILEKHAEVLMALGRTHSARATAEASIEMYRAWGAFAKVTQLERLTFCQG